MAETIDLKEAEEVFRSFIQDKHVLIVDPAPAVRAGVSKVIKEMGAKVTSVTLCTGWDEAMQHIVTLKPQVVISEFVLDEKHRGMKLFEKQHQFVTDTDQRLSILVTANARESSIAEAAEGDVDSYILKPFTPQTVREYLARAAWAKCRPNPYQMALNEGRSLMKSNQLERAEFVFTEARKESLKPSLACYYLGRVCALRLALAKAEGSYRSGLEYNPIHYRCLTGLLDLYLMGRRDLEAYGIARTLIHAFPISMHRMEEIVRLVVRTRRFEHADLLIDLYDGMEDHPPELTRLMAAMLVVAGIHYLAEPGEQEGYPITLFQRAAILSSKAVPVMTEIVTKLVAHKRHVEAGEFLKQFSPETQGGREYQLMEFLVHSASGLAPRVVEHGRRLLKAGIDDPRVYEVLIERELEIGHDDGAEGLIYAAAKRYPALKDSFFKRLKP